MSGGLQGLYCEAYIHYHLGDGQKGQQEVVIRELPLKSSCGPDLHPSPPMALHTEAGL